MRALRSRSRVVFAVVVVSGGLALAGACIPDVVPDPSTLPHCSTLDGGCGDGTDDCCTSDHVAGGTFNRINDASFTARIDQFRLDRYEVTVGRFRAFYAGYAVNKPKAGDGASPVLGPASGWNPGWDTLLPKDQNALNGDLGCSSEFSTWTDPPAGNENKPINCVSWYVAFAFCAWDGGRLPTEAEWNYAAAGGDSQRAYPWGNDAPDGSQAVYGCQTDTVDCPLPNVGSTPLGQGRFLQMDLAGSVAEWTLDYYSGLPTGCDDKCAELIDAGLGRDLRGGDFAHDATEIATTYRVGVDPGVPESYIGFRCARAQ